MKYLQLNDDEIKRFEALPPQQGAAWKFWKAVCVQYKVNLQGTASTVVELRNFGGGKFAVVESGRKVPKQKGRRI